MSPDMVPYFLKDPDLEDMGTPRSCQEKGEKGEKGEGVRKNTIKTYNVHMYFLHVRTCIIAFVLHHKTISCFQIVHMYVHACRVSYHTEGGKGGISPPSQAEFPP